jgi:Na+/H+-translocating membrane pyrophosphatase
MFLAVVMFLPNDVQLILDPPQVSVNRWWFAVIPNLGLISGLIIGVATDYYTSNQHSPV